MTRPAHPNPPLFLSVETPLGVRAITDLTLRDVFAAAALSEFASALAPQDAAARAYDYADAMLAARAAKESD